MLGCPVLGHKEYYGIGSPVWWLRHHDKCVSTGDRGSFVQIARWDGLLNRIEPHSVQSTRLKQTLGLYHDFIQLRQFSVCISYLFKNCAPGNIDGYGGLLTVEMV